MKMNLNCDLGEKSEHYSGINDRSLIEIINTANIACGYHAGSESIIEATIKIAKENNVSVGPYARLRPGTILKSGSKVGNFVEVKKSTIGRKSKVNHLSYIGDASIGKNVNIGAGTITCNYDGKNKNKTKILDGAFIGSNSSLVAPIKIGKNSVVGAGSALTKNVKNKSLSLTRSNQIEIKNYKRK